jgi:hypothetical protein
MLAIQTLEFSPKATEGVHKTNKLTVSITLVLFILTLLFVYQWLLLFIS